MDSRLIDQRIRCPFCAEPMSIVVDLSAGSQSYIEDCEVCCRPMQIIVATDDGALESLQVDCAS